MFRPTYRYTTRLVDSLLKVENARASVDALPLAPAAAREFQQGQRVGCLEAASLLQGEPLPGYERALTLATRKTEGAPDEAALQRLQGALMGAGEVPYRTSSDLVYSLSGHDVVFVPPDASEVPGLISDLLTWVRLAWERVPAVVVAAICQQELRMIRPFDRYSSAFALLSGDLVLARRGYGFGGYAWAEVGLSRNMDAYASAIASTHTGVYPSQADFTAWLEFFSHTLAGEVAAAAETVVGASRAGVEGGGLPADGPVYLKERQRQLLEYARLNGAIRSGQYQELVHVVPDTARRDFIELMEKGLIAVRGVGRGTHYVLTVRGLEETGRLSERE